MILRHSFIFQDEINQLLSQSLNESDDADVKAEMEALEEQELRSEIEAMPKVPQTRPIIEAEKLKPAAGLRQLENAREEAKASRLEPMLAS